MCSNVIQFPGKPAEMSEFDKLNEGFMTDYAPKPPRSGVSGSAALESAGFARAGRALPVEGATAIEERAAAAANLARHYAEQRSRESLCRGNGREISLETFAARMEYQARKQQPTQNAEGVHVGDLFYGSWGYEQTNVDFFQVVALKGRHTAVLREIGRDYIGGYAMQGNVRPCRDAFISDEAYTVRTKMCDYYNPPQLRLNHPTASGHSLERIDDDREIGYSSYY